MSSAAQTAGQGCDRGRRESERSPLAAPVRSRTRPTIATITIAPPHRPRSAARGEVLSLGPRHGQPYRGSRVASDALSSSSASSPCSRSSEAFFAPVPLALSTQIWLPVHRVVWRRRSVPVGDHDGWLRSPRPLVSPAGRARRPHQPRSGGTARSLTKAMLAVGRVGGRGRDAQVAVSCRASRRRCLSSHVRVASSSLSNACSSRSGDHAANGPVRIAVRLLSLPPRRSMTKTSASPLRVLVNAMLEPSGVPGRLPSAPAAFGAGRGSSRRHPSRRSRRLRTPPARNAIRSNPATTRVAIGISRAREPILASPFRVIVKTYALPSFVEALRDTSAPRRAGSLRPRTCLDRFDIRSIVTTHLAVAGARP